MNRKGIALIVAIAMFAFVAQGISEAADAEILRGHTGIVWSVAFSSDGQTLASGSGDRTVRLWDVNTGTQLKILTGHTGYVSSVAFSSDGQTLASGSGDNTVRLWDVNTGTQLKILTGHTDTVLSVAFSSDGQTLASGSWDKTVRLWDVNTGTQLKILTGHTSIVSSVAFSSDGQTLASGSWDDTVRLWDVNTGTQLKIITGHTSDVFSVAFSSDGQTLASGSQDSTVRLWDVNTGKQLKIITGHTSIVRSVAFSSDGQTLASGSQDDTVRLWDVNTGKQLKIITGHTTIVFVTSVAFSSDGQTLASGSLDKIVRLWDVSALGIPAGPDLVIESESVRAVPSTVAPGAEFKLYATLKNIGTGESSATTLRYYRSSNDTISTSDTRVGDTDSVSALAANRTSDESVTLNAPTTPGIYYYGACVESVNNESNTNNNCSTAVKITVEAPPTARPDLIVEPPRVSKTTLAPGEGFTLYATVKNRGTGQSVSTTLHYYFSNNSTFPRNDTHHIAETDSISKLSANHTSDQNIIIKALNAPGTYYFKACVDSVPNESNTNNNCSTAVKITVEAPPAARPDLVVENPRVSTGILVLKPGESFRLHATVRNSGTGQSASTTLRYYRSSNATISTSDTRVGDTDSVSALAANRTSDESVTLNAPTTPGIYYYGACVESVNNESNTNNNCSTAVKITVEAPPTARPDLVVENPRVSTGILVLKPGESFRLHATVRNSGTGQSASTTLRYYRSSNATISTSDTRVGDTDSVSALAANRTSGESVELNAPTTPGTYYYYACVNSVPGESNTNNNCSKVVSITVEAPMVHLGLTVPIYWTAEGKIQRLNPDSSDVEDLVTGLPLPDSIALDVSNGKMYWTDDIARKIQRANLDGSHVEDLLTNADGLMAPVAIALDVSNDKMYWTDDITHKIHRTNLDGNNNVEDLVTGLLASRSIKLDLSNRKMYWVDLEKIHRANLDGSDKEDFITRADDHYLYPVAIALDVSNRKIYWSTHFQPRIKCANLDDFNIEPLIQISSYLKTDIALDVPNGKIYWTYSYKIQRANLDGSNVEDIITGLRFPSSIALDLSGTVPVSQPDLVIESESVRAVPSTVAPGAEFKLYATLKNIGTGESSATTFRYFHSDDDTISTSDTQLGTGNRDPLPPNGTVRRYLTVTAPDTPGTYYYGVCVDKVANESDTSNNCSDAISVTVEAPTGQPDLIVETPLVSDSTLSPGQSFTLYATVKNGGIGQSAGTTLRYYRSSDGTISTRDTEIGTDSVSAIAANGESDQSIIRTAPTTPGTYYYGACVESVANESDTDNNCSPAVRVTVTPDHSNTRDGATTISVGPSTSGGGTTGTGTGTTSQAGYISSGSDVDYFRVEVNVTGTLTVYTTGNLNTVGELQDSSGAHLADDDDSGDDNNFRIERAVGAGTYYTKVRGYGSDTGSYTFHVNFEPDEVVDDVVSENLALYWIYWTKNALGKLQRVNLDNTSVPENLATISEPYEIVVDVTGGKIYWTERTKKRIMRANLDGSSPELLISISETDFSEPVGLVLDALGGKLYWTVGKFNNFFKTYTSGEIWRANLDGSGEPEKFLEGLWHPSELVIDVISRDIYWKENTDFSNTIWYVNVDRPNVKVKLVGLNPFQHKIGPMVLDTAGGKLYWVNHELDGLGLWRANLNGIGEPEKFPIHTGLTGTSRITDMTIDTANGKLYAAYINKIVRVNLDGTGEPEIIHELAPTDWEIRTQGITSIALNTIGIDGINFSNLDVNRDGVLDAKDLVYISERYGMTGENRADVNGDEIVNIDDLILVAAAIDNAIAVAPAALTQKLPGITVETVKRWLTEAELSGKKSPIYQRGIFVLEQLLGFLVDVEAIPDKTSLLANYPNPFNPETWIPYQLAKPADVTLTIYDINGHVVRDLDLGHQPVGIYKGKNRAAHWDGRNAQGEPVASGVYFYTLKAGDFTATRKMLIRK